MTTAEKLRQEGWTKGHGEGLEEGRKDVLLKQLGLRFGKLPAPVTRRVRGADSAQLDRWTERVLTARTLDEVFANETP